MKVYHLTYKTVFLSLCAALAACSEQEFPVNPEEEATQKTPIELSIGGLDSPVATTRAAVITDGTNKTLQAFDVNTKIFMVMKSTETTVNHTATPNTKYTVARGDVAANATTITFDANNIRYWDDAFARNTLLDVWAYAQKGQPWTTCTFQVPNPGGSGINAYSNKPYDTTTKPNPVWGSGSASEIYPAIRSWKASHLDDRSQNQTTVQCQDLLFSNNLTNSQSYVGRGGDNRMKYNTTTHKFPQVGEAQMVFYHAMSKITLHIKKGGGFTTSDPFAFATGTNVKLMNFNNDGLFNIKTGQFEYIHGSLDIPKIYQWSTAATGDAFTLEALVIPNVDGNVSGLTNTFSRFTDGDATKMMEFTIDNNKYQISQDQLYDALHANAANAAITANGVVNLEAGKNYVFTLTIGKQQITNITAQVADWENVTAEPLSPTSARISLLLEERGTAQTSNVAVYKKEDNKTTDGIADDYTSYNWKTGYTNLNASYDSANSRWTTNSFWNSNKDFYHFRALMPSATGVTVESTGSDFATLTSAANYTDIRWGAPMKDDGANETAGTFKWNYGPLTNGFDGADNIDFTQSSNADRHQIYKAIGPTQAPVKLILFHMMSDLTFNIKTTTDADKVELCHSNTDGTFTRAKVDLVGFYNGGKVLLGSGLVQTTGTASTVAAPVNIPWNSATDNTAYVPQKYTFGAVPQDLTNVKLYITAPDNNQYIVDLKDITATTINTSNIVNPYQQQTNGKYILNRWYPGFKYVYTITLKKTGIADLYATLLEWEEVEADNEDVQIK